MKRVCLLMVIIVSTSFISCDSKRNEPQLKTSINNELSNNDIKNYHYNDLLMSIDSMNLAYGYKEDELRGFTDFLPKFNSKTTADFFGSMVGKHVGGRLGATVGASIGFATANPVFGVAGYLAGRTAGRAAGAVLASAAASYAASLIFGYSGIEEVAEPSLVTLSDSTTYGDLHNILIEEIRKNGNNYLSKDGSVDVESIYNDMLDVKNELGLPDDISQDLEYKEDVIDYINEAVKIRKETLNTNNSNNDYYLGVRNYTIKEFAIPNHEIVSSEKIADKLTSASKSFKNNDIKLSEYSRDFIEVVNSSRLSPEDKEAISLSGLISISSNSYWDKLDEKKN